MWDKFKQWLISGSNRETAYAELLKKVDEQHKISQHISNRWQYDAAGATPVEAQRRNTVRIETSNKEYVGYAEQQGDDEWEINIRLTSTEKIRDALMATIKMLNIEKRADVEYKKLVGLGAFNSKWVIPPSLIEVPAGYADATTANKVAISSLTKTAV